MPPDQPRQDHQGNTPASENHNAQIEHVVGICRELRKNRLTKQENDDAQQEPYLTQQEMSSDDALPQHVRHKDSHWVGD